MHSKPQTYIIPMLRICLLLAVLGINTPAGAEVSRSISVRFPAFSLSPGERISGMTFKTSKGRIHVGCTPNRWACDQSEGSVHCYALHATYATAISGMLPELIISRLSDDCKPSFEASVDLIDESGKEYSRDIREDDLIVR